MRIAALLALLLASPLAAGCGTDEAQTDDDNEVITRVALTMTRADAPATVVTAGFDDADGPGGNAPVIDPIALEAGHTYNTSVTFEDGLEDPAEDITEEVRDESYQHQLFFTGDAVSGPASNHPGAPITQAYADLDENGLPIGLSTTFTTTAGSGSLTATLRHLPALNGVQQKTAGLADEVKANGFGTLAGTTDAQVTFVVTVPGSL